MSTALNKNLDRRNRTRSIINTQIEYKVYDDTSYTAGKLIDLSQTGVLIELKQKLPTHTQLSLLLKTDEIDEPPLELNVEIIRIAEITNDTQYTYGCMILDIINF